MRNGASRSARASANREERAKDRVRADLRNRATARVRAPARVRARAEVKAGASAREEDRSLRAGTRSPRRSPKRNPGCSLARETEGSFQTKDISTGKGRAFSRLRVTGSRSPGTGPRDLLSRLPPGRRRVARKATTPPTDPSRSSPDPGPK